MAGIRRLERWAILAAAVFVAACGSSGTAPQTLPPGAASAEAASAAQTTPPVTVDRASPGQSLPPGVTVVDAANSIQRLDWSPSGKLLAVLTWGGELGTGRADILDLAGRRIASFDAFDMAWVDDTHLMTLVVSPNDIAHGTVTVHSIDGTDGNGVPGTFGGLLSNGHGSVALMAPVAASEDPADESFQIWSNGHLGARIAGYGLPARWSADGRLLALVGESATGSRTRGGDSETAISLAVGGSIPGTLSVLKLPEKAAVLSRPLADIRLDVYFSPDGSQLATSDGLILNLTDGGGTQLAASAEGWTSAGALVVVGQDHRVSLWTPAGTTAVPNAFDWADFGPSEGDVATLPAADENLSFPVTAVVRHAGGAVSIPLNVGLIMAAWSSGGICFIATGTIDAQREDNRLLRIELPAS
ncbi:MAG: hypothetical protein ABSB34_09370 [Candidatus Limnocylindrales bacterium]|jgi:hypothetical protein